MKNIFIAISRDHNGHVDYNQTLAEFNTRINELIESENTMISMVTESVAKTLEEKPGLNNITMDVFTSYVMQTMRDTYTVQDNLYPALKEKVANYIRERTDMFDIGRGKNQGVKILERLSQEEMQKVIDKREREAKKQDLKKKSA